MSPIIPGFAARWDMGHLLQSIAPRPLLIVSAADDQYSKDAASVIAGSIPNDHITHYRAGGGHALTPERVEYILTFLTSQVSIGSDWQSCSP